MNARVGVNLRASAFLHQGDRKYMEDECEVAYQKTANKRDIEYAYFGIFDGHGGKEAALYAKDNLMDHIVSQKSFWSDDDDEVLSAIREGFIQAHHSMWKLVDHWPKTPSGWPSTSGTTASIAFIRRHKIYIGHVGDSGIVMGVNDDNVNGWVGISLTQDHKPESNQEMARIERSGGKVVRKAGVSRVVWNRPRSGHQGPVRRSTPMDEIPFLAVARSLGDLWSYNANNNQFVVSPEPDTFVLDIDITRHRCLIFGTDGLWNAISAQTAVNIALATEKNNEKHYLGYQYPDGEIRKWINPSTSIVYGALERYKRNLLRADNTSAITVFIDAPGRPKREVLLEHMQNTQSNKALNMLKPQKKAYVKVHYYAVPEKEETDIEEDSMNYWNQPDTSTTKSPFLFSDRLSSVVDVNNFLTVRPVSKLSLPESNLADDIQSPVVSSTSEAKVSRSPKKENSAHSLHSSTSDIDHNTFPVDSTSSRILKNVNRSNISVKSSCNKRKRDCDSDDESSSKRISTRSSVLSARPMITRSQERLRKLKRNIL